MTFDELNKLSRPVNVVNVRKMHFLQASSHLSTTSGSLSSSSDDNRGSKTSSSRKDTKGRNKSSKRKAAAGGSSSAHNTASSSSKYQEGNPAPSDESLRNRRLESPEPKREDHLR